MKKLPGKFLQFPDLIIISYFFSCWQQVPGLEEAKKVSSIKKYELSNPQQRIWLTEFLHNRLDMANIGYLIELKGKYDLDRLCRAIKFVVKANRGLQLRFEFTDREKGELKQYFPGYEEIDVEKITAAREEELFARIEKIHRQQFEVTGKYLCSFAVFSIDNKRFGLFEKAHHLVADGISAVNVAREVVDTYHKLEDNTFEYADKEYSYADFLEGEKKYIESEKYQRDKEYWLQRFENFSGEEITFELNKNKKNSLKVTRGNYFFPEHMIESAEEYKANNRLSNFPLFMAALGIYFNRFFDHEDMVIGMPVHNRSQKIYRDMVGMFVSTVPFRIKFEQEWSFNELVAYVKKELWNTLKHQGYPFNHLVNDFKEANIDSSGMLNVQLIELPGGNEAEVEKRAFFSTQYNISQLSIYLNQQNSPGLDDLEVAVDYHVDIFAEREVEALFKRLTVILDQAIKEPERKISELSLLEEKEYKEVIYELNNTAADFPGDKTIPRLFEEQVQKNPGNTALEYEEKRVTYSELKDLTGKLAAKLQASGIGPGAIVGMLCERSLEAIVSILAVLQAGGAYVPIDPAYPVERKSYIIENSGIKVLLIEKELEQQESEFLASAPNIKNIIVDYHTLMQETVDRPFEKPGISSDDLAYIIYTSGTTGNPKGTLLRHRNVINYIWWGANFYVKGGQVSFPLYTSLSFDLTVTSIFIPLITGNKIVIYRESEEGLLIEKVVRDNKVDIMKLTPSHLKIIKELKCKDSKIKSFIVGGEELRTDTAAEIDDYFSGNINIYNEYGPTETAVGCMIHRYDKNKDFDMGVPIGKPSANVQIYILDKNKRPLPMGIIGEIYIGGAGVASGYLKNKELTEEKFVDNPFVPGEKMYKSGDLGRWNLDKVLEFYGRSDEQVKIRGYRIEPGEIEKQLLEIEGTKDVVVVVVEKAGQKSLCAYMVPEVPDEAAEAGEAAAGWFDPGNFRKKLGENLPAYMVPAFFVQLDKIPLTNNGKLDRKALPEPRVRIEQAPGTVPVTELEKTVQKVWSDVLGFENIGMEDNIYDLGGDSIKAVQIASRLHDMDLSVNARDILDNQTINRLMVNVDFYKERKIYEQGLIEGSKNPSPIESWFFARNFENPHYFNQSVLLQFKEEIDIDVLQKCFALLIKHHDGLRLNADLNNKTLFYNNDHLKSDIKIDVFNIPGRAGDKWEDKIKETGEKIKSSFDIQSSLLIKPAVINVEPGQHYLLITAHHLVIDGVSWRILLEDLYNSYRGFLPGAEVKLPGKTASLSDWKAHLDEYSQQEEVGQQVSYWQEIAAADFSITGDKVSEDEFGSIKDRGRMTFTMKPEQTELISTGIRKSFRSDIEVVLIIALGIALKGHTGRQEIVMELENFGRVLEDIDLSRTIGWFTAMYPKLIKMDREDLTGLIKSVKEQLIKTPNNGIGYGILKYLANKITGNFVSQVRFNYLGQFDREVSNDLFTYSNIDTGEDIGKENALSTPVEINCMIVKGELILDLYYSKKLFSKEQINDLFDRIKKALQQMVSYFETEDDVHFTPSDFDTVDLDEDDLDALFA